MSNFDNPTADELIVLGAAQRNRLKVLNVLPSWSDKDIEDLLLSHHQWDEAISWWCVPVSALSEIAFDSRTPERWSQLLQRMVQHAKATNQLTISPKSGFEL